MSFLVTRSVLAFAGLIDLAASLLLIVSYHTHMTELTVALEFALLPWQALHVFSWFGSLLVSSGSPGRSFGQMMLAAYIGVILGDIISSFLRTFLVSGTTLFIQVTFWTTIALVFVDGVNLLFLWFTIVTSSGEEEDEEDKPREPWAQTLQRRILPWLWILELIFIALQIILYTIGLNRSPTFSRIILLEAAHAFIWLLHRVITGGVMRDDGIRRTGWYWLGVLTSGALTLAGASGGAARIFYIITGRDETAVLLPNLGVVSGWLQFSFGLVLFAISLLQLLSLGSIMSSERPESLPILKKGRKE